MVVLLEARHGERLRKRVIVKIERSTTVYCTVYSVQCTYSLLSVELSSKNKETRHQVQEDIININIIRQQGQRNT